jgi:hypothetical protein
LREGLSYYFLLKHMKNYDKSNTYINPALEDAPAKCLNFFERRCGYLEIVRDERLERVYFQLPEECVNGAVFDRRPFDEMFAMEQREEFDKKNKDYVQNMIHIVEKIQFHDQIRQTKFAWTVTQWDLIRQMNFVFTLFLHTLLVFGGYMPVVSRGSGSFAASYEERIQFEAFNSSAEEGGDRRKGGASASVNTNSGGGDDGDFSLTPTDIDFFYNVEPVVNVVARVMNWINLITCGFRFFAFAWAELPIVIRRALEAEEEEAEVEEGEGEEIAADEQIEELGREPGNPAGMMGIGYAGGSCPGASMVELVLGLTSISVLECLADVVFVENRSKSQNRASASVRSEVVDIDDEAGNEGRKSLLMKQVYAGITSPIVEV